MSDTLLTIQDVAERLKLTPQTIYNWAKAGKLPGGKIGKVWRFRESALDAWIDRQFTEGHSGR